MALLTSAVILTIQSSVVVSLGMVGALSIVRFRTAIKDPMDLVFLFWSISVGIICGAGLSEIALLVSLAVTLLIFVLDRIPAVMTPMILVVSGRRDTAGAGSPLEERIMDAVSKYSRYATVKTTRLTGDKIELSPKGRNANELSVEEFEKNYENFFEMIFDIAATDISGLSGYIIAEKDNVLLICQKEDSSAMVRKLLGKIENEEGMEDYV